MAVGNTGALAIANGCPEMSHLAIKNTTVGETALVMSHSARTASCKLKMTHVCVPAVGYRRQMPQNGAHGHQAAVLITCSADNLLLLSDVAYTEQLMRLS